MNINSRKICIFFAITLYLLGSCKQKYELDQADVLSELKFFGQTNADSLIEIRMQAGIIRIKLYQDTPLHRANFVRLIKAGYYKDRQFYRILPEVCAQSGGGSYASLRYLIPNEIQPHRFPKRGTIAMARYHTDNPNKMSSASEFFIINAGHKVPNKYPKVPKSKNDWYAKVGGFRLFDQEYTIFGEVIEGLDLVDKIANQRVYDSDHPENTYIYSMYIVK
jgi:cyclophilin family peptidyl-prolyl cis-trans isomerase